MIAEKEINKMSVAERLRTIEALWESIPLAESSINSPDWHGEVLASRKAKVRAGKGEFLSLEALRERFRSSE
jgi:putative addiction module component (TIGR02574 family)